MFARSARFYDAIYSFKDYGGESRTLQRLIARYAPQARTLLDVACGTGLHLQHLRQDYEVAGLDLDDNLLHIAAERNPGVSLHHADMVDFDLGRTFDVVTCLFSSIGYVRTVDRLGEAVKSMARHLTVHGILVVEPWIFPQQFEEGRTDALVVDFDAGKLVRATFSSRKDAESHLDLHYLVRAGDGAVTHFREDHVLGLFSDEQYRAALARNGLELLAFDPEGLMGRGLYIAARRARDERPPPRRDVQRL